MKTMPKTSVIVILFLILTASLLFTGCIKKTISSQPPVRYQMVHIPGYQKHDYENLLKSKNDDLRYNAVCNLIPYAREYAAQLSKNSNENGGPRKGHENEEKKNAYAVYHLIRAQLGGTHEGIKAASLIFLSEFSTQYAQKSELLDLVAEVQSNNIRTQYEQLNALIKLADRDSQIDPKLIISFLRKRSWLIKSMTYILLSKIQSDPYHPTLIKAYRRSQAEIDKILILNVFENGFDVEVFELFKDELETGQNPKVKEYCAGTIKNCRNDSAVIQWLISRHTAMDNETLKALIGSYYPELSGPKGIVFFKQLFASDRQSLIRIIDREAFFKHIYDAGFSNQQDPNPLSGILQAVQFNTDLNKHWSTYISKRRQEEALQKEQDQRSEAFEKNVLPKYTILLENFLKDSEKLFAKEGLDPKEVKEATNEIREFLQILKKD